jgi:hypothetical protein
MRNMQSTPLLDRMAYNRIFVLQWTGTKFVITEACQRYNSADLTPDDIVRLGTEMIVQGKLRMEGRK